MRRNKILIACEVVAEELQSRIGRELPVRLIDPALHVHPDRLRSTLQEAIDQEERSYETIILGYGLCSRAVEGLKSKHSRMIIPRVDDCIGLFLGSRTAHLKQLKTAPGTFFLSRGWVAAGSTPFTEYDYMMKRFGRERADRLIRVLLGNYTHLAYIDMEEPGAPSTDHEYARQKAQEFKLEYQELSGSPNLFESLIRCEENDQLQFIPPGEAISYEMFIGKNA